MLDPRIYRAAFLPVVLAIIVTAFSLQDRPRPIGTTLAPDAFLGVNAKQTLDDLAERFPERRPGGADDTALAGHIASRLRDLGTVTTRSFDAQTIDGKRSLQTVIATRTGAPGRGLVVVSHRDAAGTEAKAELSGTAAMLELARVLAAGRLRRTITFASTSGGSGGSAGAADLAKALPRSTNAVIVIGNVGGASVRRPFITAYSNGEGQAPLQLTRTLEAAVKAQSGTDPGGPRALSQWARLAFPLTTGEQGELGRHGFGAVQLQVSGERPPPAGDEVDARRLELFGRAVLRALFALDNGPDIAEGPRAQLVTSRKVLPGWAVRLIVGALLLPPLIAAVDGFARVRRRRQPVSPWVAWVLAGALPFAAAAVFALLLAWTGLIAAAPGAPVAAGAVLFDGAAKVALVSVGLVFALAWLVRPLALRAAARRLEAAAEEGPAGPGGAAALALVLCSVAFVAWVVNPFAAGLLVLPANIWLLVAAPEVRLPRGVALLLVVLALAPLAGVAVADARALGYGPVELLWAGVLLVGGGHVGPLTWLLWSVVGACFVAAAAIALRSRGDEGPEREVTVRGPVGYAGPGSLGGTESALRR
jgi:hypothetical protein